MTTFRYEGSVWRLFEDLLYDKKRLSNIYMITIDDRILIEEISPEVGFGIRGKMSMALNPRYEPKVRRVKFFLEVLTETEEEFLTKLKNYLIYLSDTGYDRIKDAEKLNNYVNLDEDVRRYNNAKKYGYCHECDSELPRIPSSKYIFIENNHAVLGLCRIKEDLGLVKKYRLYLIAYSEKSMNDALNGVDLLDLRSNPVRIYYKDGSLEEFYITV